ncbi:hypothetical protein HYQ44_020232 [Verticillium longisporum]|nr:hypothetical protein HYQ44_020232 [Verticillium longisporum]
MADDNRPFDFDQLPDDDLGPRLNATVWSLTAVSGLFLGLRLYCKFTRRRGLWLDDHFLIAAWCSPVDKTWRTVAVEGTCWPQHVHRNYNIASSAYSGAMDVLLAMLPWRMIWGLELTRREKLGVLIAMSMGVFAGIVSFVKISTLHAIGDSDMIETVDLVIWGAAESAVTIIAASIPVLRAMFQGPRAAGEPRMGTREKALLRRLNLFSSPSTRGGTNTGTQTKPDKGVTRGTNNRNKGNTILGFLRPALLSDAPKTIVRRTTSIYRQRNAGNANMAEIVGLVASSIALAEVVGKVGGGILKLKRMWDEVKDVPESIQDLFKRLDLILRMVARIARDIETGATVFEDMEAVESCILCCQQVISDEATMMNDLIVQIDATKRVRRVRDMVRVALKRDVLERHEKKLEGMIQILILADSEYTREGFKS